jgi:hypothetical protein
LFQTVSLFAEDLFGLAIVGQWVDSMSSALLKLLAMNFVQLRNHSIASAVVAPRSAQPTGKTQP